MDDSELIAMVVGKGTDLPMDRISPEELRRNGNEPAARRLEAALEIGDRMVRAAFARRPLLDSPGAVIRMLRRRFREDLRERFLVLLLDGRNRVVRIETVSMGTSQESLVVPKDVLREVVREGASGVIFVHNHPSGSPVPSREDVVVTARLKKSCDLLGIRMVDHVIVAGEGVYSFAEEVGLDF
jgi:DNA repair protein RadC